MLSSVAHQKNLKLRVIYIYIYIYIFFFFFFSIRPIFTCPHFWSCTHHLASFLLWFSPNPTVGPLSTATTNDINPSHIIQLQSCQWPPQSCPFPTLLLFKLTLRMTPQLSRKNITFFPPCFCSTSSTCSANQAWLFFFSPHVQRYHHSSCTCTVHFDFFSSPMTNRVFNPSSVCIKQLYNYFLWLSPLLVFKRSHYLHQQVWAKGNHFPVWPHNLNISFCLVFSNGLLIQNVSHLALAIEYYTHKHIQAFQLCFLISQYSRCSTVDTVVSPNIFQLWSILMRECLLFEQQQLYCPVISRLVHPAPFGITLLVGFFIIPSVRLQV